MSRGDSLARKIIVIRMLHGSSFKLERLPDFPIHPGDDNKLGHESSGLHEEGVLFFVPPSKGPSLSFFHKVTGRRIEYALGYFTNSFCSDDLNNMTVL